MHTRKDLANAIRQMSYAELKAVSIELADAIKDKDARPKLETAEEFADLLSDWAEAQRG
jgi:hypothetical protein